MGETIWLLIVIIFWIFNFVLLVGLCMNFAMEELFENDAVGFFVGTGFGILVWLGALYYVYG